MLILFYDDETFPILLGKYTFDKLHSFKKKVFKYIQKEMVQKIFSLNNGMTIRKLWNSQIQVEKNPLFPVVEAISTDTFKTVISIPQIDLVEFKRRIDFYGDIVRIKQQVQGQDRIKIELKDSVNIINVCEAIEEIISSLTKLNKMDIDSLLSKPAKLEQQQPSVSEKKKIIIKRKR